MSDPTQNPPPGPVYTDKDLYGPSGKPQSADIAQGQLGDCYFVAPLGAMAGQQPERIQNAISYNADKGTFNVTFYQETHSGPLGMHTESKPVQIEVNQADIKADAKDGVDGLQTKFHGANAPLWPSVMETAFAKMAEQKGENISDGLHRIGGGKGGHATDTIYALTGQRDETVAADKFASMGMDKAYAELDKAIKDGRPMLLNTNPMKDMPNDGLIKGIWDEKHPENNSGHAYMLEGVSKDKDGNVMLSLRNPWGNNDFKDQGVTDKNAEVTVNLQDIIKSGHLQSIDIGPEVSKQQEKTNQQDPSKQPEGQKTQTSTGDQHLDNLLAAMHDPVAFKQAMTDLTNSPYGQEFRAQGQAQHQEIQNQQAQAQAQATQQKAQPQQTGPVMVLTH